jgi:predicted methyltransferase
MTPVVACHRETAHPAAQAFNVTRLLQSTGPILAEFMTPLLTRLDSGRDEFLARRSSLHLMAHIRQNYHDLYDKFMGPADVPAFNKAVFAALKPGGVYVVLDHVAAAGSGIGATETLHRIDPARVKADVLAAGFKLDAESSILANTSDDHTKNVFDPSVRGHTDQFLYRFKKPK